MSFSWFWTSALTLFGLADSRAAPPIEPEFEVRLEAELEPESATLAPPRLVAGPLLGAAGPTDAWVWAKVDAPGRFRLVARDEVGRAVAYSDAVARPAEALCLHFHLQGLDPGRRYRCRIDGSSGELATREELFVRTPLREAHPRARLVFGSCSHDRRYPRQRVWTAIRAVAPDAVVLLGDTPYIDSTALEVQRSRRVDFLRHPDVESALARIPWYATWDDHDFGRNDTDGRLGGKADARRAFVEHTAGPKVGESGNGVYQRFRRGPLEVFLLDTRWFAGTEGSAADEARPSLLGAQQWQWLEKGLAASDAPFKLLACGMVWNGAVRPFKRDHWMNYPHERERLLRFIGEHAIEGVVWIGGDIHRSRALRHSTARLAGYDIVEWISSPLANSVIALANVPSPALLFDVGVPETFLVVEANASVAPARLTGRFLDRDGGELWRMEIGADELRAHAD